MKIILILIIVKLVANCDYNEISCKFVIIPSFSLSKI